MKGFTFNMDEDDVVNKENSPDPGLYHKEKEWIKNSFNLRFAQGYSQSRHKSAEKEDLVLNCHSEAIKIIRV